MTPQPISDVQFLWVYMVGFIVGVVTEALILAALLIAMRRKK